MNATPSSGDAEAATRSPPNTPNLPSLPFFPMGSLSFQPGASMVSGGGLTT